jgi:hypothetical protein
VVVRSSFIPGPGTRVGGVSALELPPVLGLGLRLGIRVTEAASPPPAAAPPAHDEEQPILCVAPLRSGLSRIARVPEGGESIAPGTATGDLLSVIVRPGTDSLALAGALVPPAARRVAEPLVTSRAISFLVEPEMADDLLRLLHYELIESSTPVAIAH